MPIISTLNTLTLSHPHTDEEDESCVAAFTALPRTKWAEVRKRMEENPVNRQTLRLIDSAANVVILQSDSVDSTVGLQICKCRGRELLSNNLWVLKLFSVEFD